MNISNFIVKTLSTFFYLGYLPLIPGTFGSLAGLLILYLIKSTGIYYLLITLSLLVCGLLIVGRAEKIFNKKDPRFIVIDEVCGMLLSFMFLPYNPKLIIIGFFLFRMFDALKPYPINRLEKLKGSLGVMADDILAAVYTNIVLQIVLRFIHSPL